MEGCGAQKIFGSVLTPKIPPGYAPETANGNKRNSARLGLPYILSFRSTRRSQARYTCEQGFSQLYFPPLPT